MQNKVTKRKSSNKIRQQNITFGSNGIKLRGQVLFPVSASADAPVPGVVLCHGFGSSYRQMKPSARLLAQRGIATLIFDMRGHCSSEGIVDGRMADDIVDAWQVLKDYDEVDQNRMGLAGHSLGAMSSIMAADKVKPKVLAALSCPPQPNQVMMFEIDESFGQWGNRSSHIMEYPRQGVFPWVKGLTALGCRVWMYLFGYTARVDLQKFAESTLQMGMINVLKKLNACSKLFVFCEGDTITPYSKSGMLYEYAAEPKAMIYAKGGMHTTPIMRGSLRNQWTDWIADELTR